MIFNVIIPFTLLLFVIVIFLYNKYVKSDDYPSYLRINPNISVNMGIKDCQWKEKDFIFDYDKKRKKNCKKVITFLNGFNVKYFLAYGSALGAVRNKGIIKGDGDIDVVIPIWLNPHIFNCTEYEKIKINEYNDIDIVINSNYEVCGHNKQYYLNMFAKYLKNNYNIGCNVLKDNIHVILSRNVLLDIWLFISEEGHYRDISICKCSFCDVESYALEKSVEYSKFFYGNDCMTVVKNSKGIERMEFDSPHKKHISS